MKKLNKVQKSGIISSFTLNSIFLLGFILTLYFYSFDEYNAIEVKKNNLREKIQFYNNLENNGLTFQDFRRTDEFIKSNAFYLNNVLDIDFFQENFQNNDNTNYINFLESKDQQVIELTESDLVSQRNNTVSRVLPFYSEGVSTEGSISDLGFINYVENLLRGFNLRTNNPIGISNILVAGEDGQEADSLSSEIFYIPLDLNLVGRKSDILEFLYYIQNVGVINEITEGDNIIFYEDNVINRRINSNTRTNNLYESRIIELSSLRLPEYIDSGTNLRGIDIDSTVDMLNFIRNDNFQAGEEFRIQAGFKFFVRGLPTYELDRYIQNVVERYDNLSGEIKDSLKQANNRKLSSSNRNLILIENFLRDLDGYIKDLEPKVNNLRLSSNQISSNVDQNYKTALDINSTLDGINNIYESNKQSLNSILDN